MKLEDLLDLPAFKEDWAAKHAERWSLWYDGENDTKVYDAIEGAIREALAKAADVADDGVCHEDCPHVACAEAREIRDNIRALGAAKRVTVMLPGGRTSLDRDP
jgi:hypothetical protein